MAVGSLGGFVIGGGGPALTGVGVVASPFTAAAGAATGAGIGLAVGKAITGALYSDRGGVQGGGDDDLDLRDLSNPELRRFEKLLREDGYQNVEQFKTPGGRGASKFQLRVDKKTGDIYVTPRRGSGSAEPTEYNIRDLP